MEKIFRFLSDIAIHNDREWFHAHRHLYEEAQAEFVRVVETMIDHIGRFDSEVIGLPVNPRCTVSTATPVSHRTNLPTSATWGPISTRAARNPPTAATICTSNPPTACWPAVPTVWKCLYCGPYARAS